MCYVPSFSRISCYTWLKGRRRESDFLSSSSLPPTSPLLLPLSPPLLMTAVLSHQSPGSEGDAPQFHPVISVCCIILCCVGPTPSPSPPPREGVRLEKTPLLHLSSMSSLFPLELAGHAHSGATPAAARRRKRTTNQQRRTMRSGSPRLSYPPLTSLAAKKNLAGERQIQ